MGQYDLYGTFDLKKHKETFPHYLEVLIKEDGTVVYAVPSHQIKALELAAEKQGKSAHDIQESCPKEYYFNYMVWLLMQSGAIAVWDGMVIAPTINQKQINTLKTLKINGLYHGPIPGNQNKE